MAEFVELRAEERMPELEYLEKMRIFEKPEVKAICKKRKVFEYKIQRLSKHKDDYMQYIQYEMDLLNIVRLRKKELEMPGEISDVERAITAHINKLFNQAIIRFPDFNVYKSYIKFCKFMGCTNSLSRMLARMVTSHSDNPASWSLAAKWELQENSSIEKARDYLLRGIHCNPNSKMLHKELFRLELMYADSERKPKELNEASGEGNMEVEQVDNTGKHSTTTFNQEQLSQNKESEQGSYGSNADMLLKKGDKYSDRVLEGRLAEVVYDYAVKKIHDIDFYIDLLEITKEFNFTRNLQKKMAEALLKRFVSDERAWDVFARLQLEGLVCIDYSSSEFKFPTSGENVDTDEEKEGMSANNKVNLKEKINHCCSVYKTAVQALPTQRMWSMYMETLLELNQDRVHLPKFKKKMLSNAFQSAHNAGHLQEKYYLQWAQLSQQKSKINSILNHATCRFPSSVALWEKRLQLHLTEDEKSGTYIFEEAISVLKKDNMASLPLWKMYIQYWQTKSCAKVEKIFENGIGKGYAVAYHLKPMFLEWIVLVKGIASARKVYTSISELVPFCLEIHQKMISLEYMQPTFNLKHTRKCYESACKQFGHDNPNIWIDYIRLEKKKGDPKNISKLYTKALEKLNSVHIDIFENEFFLVNSTVSQDN